MFSRAYTFAEVVSACQGELMGQQARRALAFTSKLTEGATQRHLCNMEGSIDILSLHADLLEYAVRNLKVVLQHVCR